MKYMIEVDRRRRAEYVRASHGVQPSWATEAVNDVDAYWRDPDPASRSGRSVRVIGWSHTAEMILTVILVHVGTDPDDWPDGDWWGANAWPSNPRDRRIYSASAEE